MGRIAELPKDLTDTIVGMALSDDVRSVVDDMKKALVPQRAGSTAMPFFASTCPVDDAKAVAKGRVVAAPMPKVMTPFYEPYVDTVEFRTLNGLTFLSESEMIFRSLPGTVDLAYRYAGMGHIMVHTYIPGPDLIVTHVDGGSNGYDREYNATKRIELVREVLRRVKCGKKEFKDLTPMGGWTRIASFVDWWRVENASVWA